MSMFNNYTSKDAVMLPPDNTHGFLELKKDFDDIIVIGEETCHTFTIDHPIAELKMVKVIYNQGTETVHTYIWPALTSTHSELVCIKEGTIKDAKSIFAVHMSAEDTFNFNSYNKDVKMQIHSIITGNDKEVSDIFKIKVVPMLEDRTNKGDDNE